MKNRIILHLAICGLSLLSSCDRNVHQDEQGVVVMLNLPTNDTAKDIQIRVFSSDDILTSHYDFASAKELGSTILNLADGDYAIVATSNENNHFTTSQKIGKTTLVELLLTMNEPYTAQSHAHYGVANVTVTGKSYTNVTVDANRVFAEVAVTINNLHEDVVAVEMIVQSSAKGLYPAIHKLTNDYTLST